MSYKELELGYQGLRAASFYIGEEDDDNTSTDRPHCLIEDIGDTLPTTYDYVYTSAHSPTRTTHPNCPICLRGVRLKLIWHPRISNFTNQQQILLLYLIFPFRLKFVLSLLFWGVHCACTIYIFSHPSPLKFQGLTCLISDSTIFFLHLVTLVGFLFAVLFLCSFFSLGLLGRETLMKNGGLAWSWKWTGPVFLLAQLGIVSFLLMFPCTWTCSLVVPSLLDPGTSSYQQIKSFHFSSHSFSFTGNGLFGMPRRVCRTKPSRISCHRWHGTRKWQANFGWYLCHGQEVKFKTNESDSGPFRRIWIY